MQANEIEAKVAVEKQKEENEARTELQLTALNENLTTLRSDLVHSQSRLPELEKKCDELRGEKLGESFCSIFVCLHVHLYMCTCMCVPGENEKTVSSEIGYQH